MATFIVRVAEVADGDPSGVLRGQVELVDVGRTELFRNGEELLEFLRRMSLTTADIDLTGSSGVTDVDPAEPPS